MRVLIDAHMVGNRETGNETYIFNLLQELPKFSDIKCGAATLFPELVSKQTHKVDVLPLKSANNWIRLAYTLPKIEHQWGAEILHASYIAPFINSCPFVVTVHDVVFKQYPEFFSPRDRILFATLLPFTLRRARAIITVSEHAKKEIVKYYPYTQGKVFVTYEAHAPQFKEVRDKELIVGEIYRRYKIDSKYILAVGNLQPRKNLVRLIQAFETVQKAQLGFKLVIVGKAQWQSSSVYAAVQNLGLEKDVIFTDYVPDTDLVKLYNAASLFVYPSLYEGFGLPILEAMACGTPVISSNNSSIPEIAGDSAILINPLDTKQMSEAMFAILTRQYLQEELHAKGLRWVAKFSWQKTADETYRVYQKILTNSV
jgi:glycosyltransferase involved in cell wall biosynthesis